MFTLYYKGSGQYSELDKVRTIKSYLKYTVKHRSTPKFYIEG